VEAAWSLVTPLDEMWREWGEGGGESRSSGSGSGRGRGAKASVGSKAPDGSKASIGGKASVGALDGSIQPYEAGTWGPEAADRLLERDGRRWRRL
jgi:glucose-6-phosphate 1-dehydrogenase